MSLHLVDTRPGHLRPDGTIACTIIQRVMGGQAGQKRDGPCSNSAVKGRALLDTLFMLTGPSLGGGLSYGLSLSLLDVLSFLRFASHCASPLVGLPEE